MFFRHIVYYLSLGDTYIFVCIYIRYMYVYIFLQYGLPEVVFQFYYMILR